MTTLKVRNRLQLPFGIVPNSLLEDKRLSLQARALAAWLVGRADGFEIRIEALKKMLGISDKIWVSARRELENVGWWNSRKFRVPSEKEKNQGRPVFRWQHEFEFLEGSTCIPPFSMDANCMDAKGGDKQTRSNHEDINQKEKTTTNNVVVADDVQDVDDVHVHELTDAGFSEKQARVLLQRHPLDKIREMISYGKEKRAKNLAGFVIRGIAEDWKIEQKQMKNRFDAGIIRSDRKTSYLGRDGFEIGDLVSTGEKIGKIEGIEQKNGKIKVIARTHDDQIFSFEKNLES